MIHVQTRRAGLLVIATTVDGNLTITAALGLTTNAAEARLLRRVERQESTR